MSEANNTFTLLYFSFLQEKSGKQEEQRIMTEYLTTQKLFDEVCQELSLDSAKTPVRASVNHTYADWQTSISAGDIVAFIPPVAGG